MHKNRTLPPEFHTILLVVVSCPSLEVSYYRIVTGAMPHKLPFHIIIKNIVFSPRIV